MKMRRKTPDVVPIAYSRLYVNEKKSKVVREDKVTKTSLHVTTKYCSKFPIFRTRVGFPKTVKPKNSYNKKELPTFPQNLST